MDWVDKGSQNQFKESEIELRFVDYPQGSIGIFSNELFNYLRAYRKKYVNVEFEVTSDFGCIRGFHETRIGDIKGWKSPWGYSGAAPWSDPWWCP